MGKGSAAKGGKCLTNRLHYLINELPAVSIHTADIKILNFSHPIFLNYTLKKFSRYVDLVFNFSTIRTLGGGVTPPAQMQFRGPIAF